MIILLSATKLILSLTCLAMVVSAANIPGVTIPGRDEYRHMFKGVASIEQDSPAEEERNLVVNIYVNKATTEEEDDVTGTNSGKFGPYVASGNEYEPSKDDDLFEPVASGYSWMG